MSAYDYSKEQVFVEPGKNNKERDFWMNKFAGEIQKTGFPYDRILIQAGEDDYQAESLTCKLPGELFPRLMKLCKASDLKLHMTLTAGLLLLLHKYSGSSDIIIGTPVLKQEVETDFINTVLALRNEVKEGMNFKELLLQVRQTIIEATENQNYPIETLIYKLNLPISGNDFPLFDVAILLENIHTKEYIWNIKYNILFSFHRTVDAVELVIEYNPLLYRGTTIQRIGNHFSNILLAAVNHVDQNISNFCLLSEKEKYHQLFELNNTRKQIEKDKCFQQIFAEQVERTPGNVAVIGTASLEPEQQIHLTYGELNHRANQLAALLKEKGIGRDHLVGILCKRSTEMLIGILGVFKASAAYIPIEIHNPRDRIKAILADSGASALLILSSSIPSAQEDEFYREIGSSSRVKYIVYLDKPGDIDGRQHPFISYGEVIDFKTLEKYPGQNLEMANQQQDLCYVIYTSGTTGQPKGVMIHHLGMLNHLYAKINDLSLTRYDIVAQTANAGFDISVWQFLSALLVGGCTVIISREIVLEPGKLLPVLQKQQVTILESVPSLIQAFLEMVEEQDERGKELKSLRWMIPTGEALSVRLVREWMTCYPGIKLVNAYGPTEASDDVTHYMVEQLPPAEQQGIPIGKALQNLNVFVLDRHLDLCPPGVRGEICVAGIGVGRGYLNDLEKTGESFISNPYIDEIRNPGYQVLYKTGDVGFLREDGNIECLGRLDTQVKIRGNRIELGEIESRLLKHEAVKNAIVTVKEDSNGNKFLCAYVVPVSPGKPGSINPGEAALVIELREFLLKELPDYMVPAYFVPLAHIPLTANGKVDGKALPEPELEQNETYAAPRTAKEKKLVEIFKSVLGRPTVGIDDNFFMIGGDSIRSIQIISRLNSAGYKLEMKDLFDYPTISQLAQVVEESSQETDQSPISGVIPLTPIQIAFFENSAVLSPRFIFSFMLRLKERLDQKIVKAIFTKLQEHHDALRMTFKKGEDGRIIQTNHGMAFPLGLEVYDLRDHENAVETLQRKAKEMVAGIDIENGPLMKLGLFHFEDANRLFINIHHLVSDGVSLRILFEDIETLYQQYKRGEKFALPLKTDSYKTWAEKLSQYANSKLFLEEKTYWQELEATEVPPLEKDFKGENNNYLKDSAQVSFRLNEEETGLLLTKVNESFKNEINDILLTAFALSIKNVYSQDKVMVVLEGHGREDIIKDINTARTMGWFTSEFPVILDVSYSYDLARQIIETKESLRRIPHRGIGYGILKYLTKNEHKQDIVFKSQPQIIFNYLGQVDTGAGEMSFAGNDELEINITSSEDEETREYEWDVIGIIEKKQLAIVITFNRKQYQTERMEALITHFQNELRRIISFCVKRKEKKLTPSDLTYKELPIDTLERLSRQYAIEDIYTLTPMQEGMLFHALYQKEQSTYFVQRSFRLYGELDISLVEKTLNELIKRHESLRTAFVYEGIMRPIQVVLKERQADFYFQDLREVSSENEKIRIIEAFKEKDIIRSFDLGKEVLIRLAIFQVNESEYEFTWSFHHILMDGWCMGIIRSEFLVIYNGFLENKPPRLPPVTPYRTYIQWIEKQSKEAAKNYWKNYLESYRKPASLPVKKNTGSNDEDYQLEEVNFTIGSEKTEKLNDLGNRHQVTLNTIIQCVWGILLGIYNGQADIVFGAVVSGRPPELAGVESMVGLFINTIPVRIRFQETSSFLRLVKKVQEDAIRGQDYHYYSLAKIQADTELKQNLLNHIIAFENIQIEPQTEQELMKEISEEKNRSSTSRLGAFEHFLQTNYDFNLIFIPLKQIQVCFQFNSLIYDIDFVKKVALHFQTVIDEILEDPQQKISEIGIISEEEKNRLIQKMKDEKGKYFNRDLQGSEYQRGKLEADLNF